MDESNFGYSHAEVSALIHSFLDDPAGWAGAGITFREVGSVEAAKVIFVVVEEATCNSPELACTHYSGWALVELEYKHLESQVYPTVGPGNIINHEAAHAFFYAAHSGSGIMADFDANRPEKPTAQDIASVETWLGTSGEPGAGTFAVGLCQLQVR